MSDKAEKIGPYELVEEIGRGAMGAVYRARHELTRREVALKVIYENVASSFAGAERFRREVSVSSMVEDEGIVEVYDAGEYDGKLFYAMELLEGEDLDSLMGELSVGEVVDIMIDVMETVAKCHTAGIVHRDLKPENIYIRDTDEGRRVKVLDFGIASIQASPTATQTGYALGTPSYMSPEQAMAPKTAGPASDIWSAGVILYQACAGDLPFVDEAPAAVMIKVVNQRHTELPQHVPSRLVEIIERCLEKKAEDRFEDATELVAELRTYRNMAGITQTSQTTKSLESTPTIAKPPASRVDENDDSRRGVYGVVAAIFAISLIVGLGLAFYQPSDNPSPEVELSGIETEEPMDEIEGVPEPTEIEPPTGLAVDEAAAGVLTSLERGANSAEERVTPSESTSPTTDETASRRTGKRDRKPTQKPDRPDAPSSEENAEDPQDAEPKLVAIEESSDPGADTEAEKEKEQKQDAKPLKFPRVEIKADSTKSSEKKPTPEKPAPKAKPKAEPKAEPKPEKAEEKPEFFSF